MIKSEILREGQRLLFNEYSKDKTKVELKAKLAEVTLKLGKELKWNSPTC